MNDFPYFQEQRYRLPLHFQEIVSYVTFDGIDEIFPIEPIGKTKISSGKDNYHDFVIIKKNTKKGHYYAMFLQGKNNLTTNGYSFDWEIKQLGLHRPSGERIVANKRIGTNIISVANNPYGEENYIRSRRGEMITLAGFSDQQTVLVIQNNYSNPFADCQGSVTMRFYYSNGMTAEKSYDFRFISGSNGKQIKIDLLPDIIRNKPSSITDASIGLSGVRIVKDKTRLDVSDPDFSYISKSNWFNYLIPSVEQ